MNTPQFDDNYWNNRYRDETTGWDIGFVSPPIKDYIDQLKDKNISILIPGCGNAYEAIYLLEKGFTNITLVDISPMLIDHLKRKFKQELGVSIHLICDDFFNIEGQFDLIIEQTFFCALRPVLRDKYKIKMHQLLNDNGKLTGILFDRQFLNSPPFGGTKPEYIQLFSADFSIKTMEPCYNSIAPREGTELFFILLKEQS